MEEQFKLKLVQLHVGNKKSVLLNKDDYFNLIEEVKVASSVTASSKTWRQYYILKRYQVLLCGDVEQLIRKRKDDANENVFFAHNDEMFDIINECTSVLDTVVEISRVGLRSTTLP